MANTHKTTEIGPLELLFTDLRDGRQSDNHLPSVPDTLLYLSKISGLGAGIIEIGFAVGDKFAQNLLTVIKEQSLSYKNTKLSIFCRTRKDDIKKANEMGATAVTIACKARLRDCDKILEINPTENLGLIEDSIKFAKRKGLFVVFDLEHGMDGYFGRINYGKRLKGKTNGDYKASRDYTLKVIETAIKAGADRVVICDTTGKANPNETEKMFKALLKLYPKTFFGFHAHNDRGLAVPNAITAITTGIMHIQGTFDGYGERIGNLNLFHLVADMQTHYDMKILTPKNLTKLTQLYRLFCRYFDREPDKRQPYFGENSATTMAGMHIQAELKDQGGYLPYDPTLVGNRERHLLADMSGRSGIRQKADEYGLSMNDTTIDRFRTANIIMLRAGAFEYSEVSFVLAYKRLMKEIKPHFQFIEYDTRTRKSFGNASTNSAIVKIQVNNKEEHTVADGDGPFDALMKALIKALVPHFPQVEKIRLTSYKSKVMNISKEGSGAHVRVITTFSYEKKSKTIEWTTVAVTQDSKDSGFEALLDAITWFLCEIKNN